MLADANGSFLRHMTAIAIWFSGMSKRPFTWLKTMMMMRRRSRA
jgi:hypothetical protein